MRPGNEKVIPFPEVMLCLFLAVAGAGCSQERVSECVVDIDCPGTQICLAGACSAYDPCAGIECQPDEQCVFGYCVPRTCSSTSCTEPPGDTACYDLPAPCRDGVCQYQPVLDRECDDGDECTGQDTCRQGGLCSGVPLRCEDPPQAECKDSQTLRAYSSPGQCQDGKCLYPAEEVNCPQGCLDGSCQGDPCQEVVCDQPPQAWCVSANMLRVYSSPGTCKDGVCSYPFEDTFCPHGCQGGSCQGDPCMGVVCDNPPADVCFDNQTLWDYQSPGTCVAGKCQYSYLEVACDNGCGQGSCQGCSPNWQDVTDCQCPPGGCEGCAGIKQQQDGCGLTREVDCDLPDGTPCGNPSNTACTNPDSCQGGICRPNHAPAGASCGDQGIDCLRDDACDGAGGCIDYGFEPDYTSCGGAHWCCVSGLCDQPGADKWLDGVRPCDSTEPCQTYCDNDNYDYCVRGMAHCADDGLYNLRGGCPSAKTGTKECADRGAGACLDVSCRCGNWDCP